MLTASKEYIKAIVNSYSEIFFLQGYLPGSVLLFSTLIDPNVGFAGLLCVLSAYVFARVIGMHKDFLDSGFYTYNPLLVGLSIGYLFKLNLLTIFFIATAGILAFITTFTLFNIFSYYLRLPVLSLPFVLVSSMAYLASSKYSNLFVNSFYPHTFFKFLEDNFPLWLTGLTKSLGAILFSPHLLSGLLFLFVLIYMSRIIFFLTLLGYFVGTFIIGILTGSFYQAFQDINHFNFILIAIAIGGVFLIPSPKSYFMAILAVAVCPFLLESAKTFWIIYGLPVFTLPFNVISLSFIYVLGLVSYPYLTKFYQGTPEKTLDYYLSHLLRFKGTQRTLALPFAGTWTVWQGIDGQWTHKGPWRYAIDFVITDERGQTYKGQGANLEDYYCFRKPVLSPVRGRVIKVINDVPDNPPGTTDKERNWGNMVTIYDERGFYVVISHFLQDSIKVKEGEWVERGQPLGHCGNSGYSPQPHIHIQVQLTPELGAPTVPFSFVQYVTQNHTYNTNQIPQTEERVTPLYPDKALEAKFSFLLDEEMRFEVIENDKKKAEILKVKMAPDGTFYFESKKGKLFFGRWEGTFYLYRIEGEISAILRAFFLALPRIPLSYTPRLAWKDYLPMEIVHKGIKKAVINFASSFSHSLAKIEGDYQFVSPDEIKGEIKTTYNPKIITSLRLHPFRGIKEINVVVIGKKDKLTLRRKE